MLNIRDFKLDTASLGAKMLLVDVTPIFEYREGKKTENQIACRYTVALPELRLEKLGVKISGQALLEKPDGFPEVVFSGLELSAYEKDGHTQITAKATGISLKNPDKQNH